MLLKTIIWCMIFLLVLISLLQFTLNQWIIEVISFLLVFFVSITLILILLKYTFWLSKKKNEQDIKNINKVKKFIYSFKNIYLTIKELLDLTIKIILFPLAITISFTFLINISIDKLSFSATLSNFFNNSKNFFIEFNNKFYYPIFSDNSNQNNIQTIDNKLEDSYEVIIYCFSNSKKGDFIYKNTSINKEIKINYGYNKNFTLEPIKYTYKNITPYNLKLKKNQKLIKVECKDITEYTYNPSDKSSPVNCELEFEEFKNKCDANYILK